MKIAVCIKQVPDTDDVKIDRKTGTLKRSEVSGILNPEDMSAVRMAAALRREMENKGEKSSLTAITMGPPAASEVLREAMACGADEGILLCDRAFAGGDTFATSLVLAEAVKKAGGFSVIFTGRQTTDGETGHVGPQLAEHLGIGQLTLVRRVNWNGRLTAVRRFEGCLPWSVTPRLLLSVPGRRARLRAFQSGQSVKPAKSSSSYGTADSLGFCRRRLDFAVPGPPCAGPSCRKARRRGVCLRGIWRRWRRLSRTS